MELIKEINAKEFDLIIIDPPYPPKPPNQFTAEKSISNNSISNFTPWLFYFKSLIKECKRVLKPNGSLIIFCDELFYAIIFPIIYENSYQTKMVVWDKQRINLGGIFRRSFELFIYVTFDSNTETSGDSDIIKCKTVNSYDRIHNYEKPIELIKKIILKTTKPNSTVLDLYSGSGVVPYTCNLINRKCIAFEHDENCFNKINQRLSKQSCLFTDSMNEQKGDSVV